MKTVDFGLYIVTYNFIIGVLLMIGSEKIGAYAGHFTGSYQPRISRLTRIAVLTFGTCIAILAFAVYFGFHVLRLHE